MALVINTNFAATTAASHLAAANQHLRRSLNRLSSGSKIVSPADDAGGLAVSMKLSAAARRQGAAMINISNSVSFLQTQDGALKIAGKVLDRMSELKTLSLDPTKSSSDVANYDTEFNALKSQLTSLGGETFNGVALFDPATLEVATTENGGGVINVGGIELLGAPAFPAFSDPFNNLSNWNTDSGSPSASGGVLALDSFEQVTTNATYTGPFEINMRVDFSGFLNDIVVRVGGLAVAQNFNTGVHDLRITVDDAGNAAAYLDGSSTAFQTTSGVPGGAQSITMFGGGGLGGVDVSNFSITSTDASGNVSGVTSASSLASLDLSSITAAIEDVATHRATNGAQQSQLGFAAELLTANKANLEAANSRIIDVDVAAEATQLARYGILVQAATSILAQANLSTQAALRLLA